MTNDYIRKLNDKPRENLGYKNAEKSTKKKIENIFLKNFFFFNNSLFFLEKTYVNQSFSIYIHM